MDKHFSKKYENKGGAFDYPLLANLNNFLFCQDACQCLHHCLKKSRILYRKEITYTLQSCCCKGALNVECPNYTQDNTILMMVLEAVIREVFSHPYISFFHLLVNGFSVIIVVTLPFLIFVKFCKRCTPKKVQRIEQNKNKKKIWKGMSLFHM